MALRHMLTFNKWPHFSHQANLAKYDESGNTLEFDWLNAVFSEYERLFNLPVKNFPYYLIGDRTAESLKARSATIHAHMESHDQPGHLVCKQSHTASSCHGYSLVESCTAANLSVKLP